VAEHSIFGGRKSMFGKEGSSDVVVDLNLTPLMDVMSNILFFLLASFGAAIVSFLNASVPVQSDTPPPEMPKNAVVLTVQMAKDGYKLNASNDWLQLDELNQLKQIIPKAGKSYDDKSLNAAVYKIKEKYPGSETLMLVPDDPNLYDEVVGAMEACREYRLDSKRKVRLFPKVVISGVLKAD
jgi:biopolymer transport protein ExbD